MNYIYLPQITKSLLSCSAQHVIYIFHLLFHDANLHKNFRFKHRRIKIIGNAVKVRQRKPHVWRFICKTSLVQRTRLNDFYLILNAIRYEDMRLSRA